MEYNVKMEMELVKLGFKRKWLSDKSGYWFEKSITKADLKLKLIIETDRKFFALDCMVYDCNYKKLTKPQYETVKLYPCNIISVKKVLKTYK